MTSMGTHEHQAEGHHQAAGRPLRRAHAAAWTVFLAMAGTTMAFQVFHAVSRGEMPWPLAVLYGTVPLMISIGVLEFASTWGLPWAQAVAYLVTGGAMFLSAAATGTVTAHAAPAHAELLFGALMDAAALLAIHFIMNGPRAAGAVAAVAAREAQLLAAADAERAAREEAARAHAAALGALGRELEAEGAAREAGHREEALAREAELSGLRDEAAAGRAAMSAQLAAMRSAHEAELSALRDALASEAQAERAARESAQQKLGNAQHAAAEALARADGLARKLAAVSAQKKDPKPAASAPNGADDDLTLEMRALNLLVADPELRKQRMGGELARRLGVSPATGRRLHAKLSAQDLPDSLSDAPR